MKVICVGGPRHGEVVDVEGILPPKGPVTVAMPGRPLAASDLDPDPLMGNSVTVVFYSLRPGPLPGTDTYVGLHPSAETWGARQVAQVVAKALEP